MSNQPFAGADSAAGSAVGRPAALVYGLGCYLAFLGVLLYAIGFVGNLLAPWSIDSEPRAGFSTSLLLDSLLLAAFAVPHSLMARPGFKRWWTRVVPPPVERSTYVLVSSLLLALVFWGWHPVPDVVWDVEGRAVAVALHATFWAGWILVVASTFLIDHADLFGLRQVYLHARDRPYTPPAFRTPALYAVIRHPIMLGFLLAFWATPRMSVGHLLFAILTTAYIFVGVWLEERDMRRAFGADYEHYRQRTGMVLPRLGPKEK